MQVCKKYEDELPGLVTGIQERMEEDCKNASKTYCYTYNSPLYIIILIMFVKRDIYYLSSLKNMCLQQCTKQKGCSLILFTFWIFHLGI